MTAPADEIEKDGRITVKRAVAGTVWGLLLVALLGEGVVRLGIAADLAGLRDPRRYAHPFCDDDYHRLRHLWGDPGALASDRFVQDPMLGWVPVETPPAPAPGQPWIAVLGDSFAAGVPPAPPKKRIPALLDRRVPDRRVIDFAVPGYGVDQIYLRFLELLKQHPAPEAVVAGILLEDMDRALERVRAGPKPYFTLRDGTLTLNGTPVRQSPGEWIEDHPPAITSFFWALISTQLQAWSEGRSGFDSECRRDEKEALTRAILTAMADEARRREIRLVAVLFYNLRSLRVGSWRADFLRSLLDSLEMEYIDTAPLLKQAVAKGHVRLSDFYFKPPNHHHNARGNRLIAGAIHRTLYPLPDGSDLRFSRRTAQAVSPGGGRRRHPKQVRPGRRPGLEKSTERSGR